MLKHRVVTAIFLLPLLLFCLFYLSPRGFSSFTAGIFIWAGYEWTNLMGFKRLLTRILYIISLIIVTSLCIFAPAFSFFSVIFIWWCIAALLVIAYPRLSGLWSCGIVPRGLMGYLVLVPCWLALNVIRNTPHGVLNVLFVLVLIWSADTGAYFIGKRFGRIAISSRVSPGKTLEGCIGGLALALIVSFVIFWWSGIPQTMWPHSILLVLVTVIFSIIGDLFESMLKRQIGVKDSGQLLPGHGGLLDRIDSLTAAAPIYVFLVLLITQYVLTA